MGVKLRTLFAVPNGDDRRFVYGANFEFSYNAKRWDTRRFTSEIRPIIGWHLSRVDVIFNPIFDTSFNGLKKLEFVPSTRIAYNTFLRVGGGRRGVRGLRPREGFPFPRRTGTPALLGSRPDRKAVRFRGGHRRRPHGGSDKLTLKLILSRDLNKR